MDIENGVPAPPTIKAGSLGDKLSRIGDEILAKKDPKVLAADEIRSEVDELANALKHAQMVCSLISARELWLQSECRRKSNGRHFVNGSTLCSVCRAYLGINIVPKPEPHTETMASDAEPEKRVDEKRHTKKKPETQSG